MHRYLLHNEDVQDAALRTASPGQTGLMNGWGVFSTLRVQDGVLFAWERHWARMRGDAAKLGVPFPEAPEYFLERLHPLLEANAAWNATLRIAVVRNRGGAFEGPGITRPFDLFAFTAELAAWGRSARLGLKPNARHAACEFAGTKVTSWAFNLAWYEEAHRLGFDEFLLLNESGEVCECTSANVFAVFGGEVLTPPLDAGCLPGVTRALLLEEISVPGVRVRERRLTLSDLESADCVFLTSSTRDAMFVNFIDGLNVGGVSKTAQVLGDALAKYRLDYTENHSAQFAGLATRDPRPR